MPADEMRSSAEQVNTTYKHNYPRQQIPEIEGSSVRTGVSSTVNRVSVGFKEGKLVYDVRSVPEYSAKEVDSACDADKTQCYRQPLDL